MEENYELAKWLAGEMSEAELIAFQKTPEFETYHKIALYSSQLEAPSFDENKLYENVISKKEKTVKVISMYQSWWFKIAAVFVFFLGLTLFYKTSIAVTQYAENGKQTSFILPDNSKVVLNAGSEIEFYKWNWDTHRHLQLTGEAYFRVAKGKKFEVQTDLGKVTVLGTQFNVKARKNRFDVTCYEGRVKVNYKNQQVLITKGERVSFENGKLHSIPNSNSLKPEWVTGELAFVNEKLSAILEEMERQFNCTFENKNISNGQLFTGTLPADNLEESMQIIASMYHLQYKNGNNHVIILKQLNVEE